MGAMLEEEEGGGGGGGAEGIDGTLWLVGGRGEEVGEGEGGGRRRGWDWEDLWRGNKSYGKERRGKWERRDKKEEKNKKRKGKVTVWIKNDIFV